MFMGEYTHAIDDKGRLTIPAKFREELSYGSVITRGYDRYLVLYTADAFKRITTAPKAFHPPIPKIARCSG
jgi:MraZ protein